MATLDDLEAALRTSFDRDTIGVYGDLLQAAGDLRGELIAIDLKLDDSGGDPDPAVARRRQQLVRKWLGGELPNGRVRYGFVELDATSADPIAQVRFAFGCPAAPYVRSIAIVGPPRLVQGAVALITAQERPNLVDVTIRQWSERDEPALDAATSKRFAVAIPNLGALELDGRRVMHDLAHANLRRLKISGWDAITTANPSLPALTDLDFAFYCHLGGHDRPPPGDFARALLGQLPQLANLDLSRNEPGYLDPYTLGGAASAVEFLRTAPIHAQLQAIRLPSLDESTQTMLRNLLPNLSALRRLSIARSPDGARAGKARDPVLAHGAAEIHFFDR
jgi:hypothetical protein